MKAENLRLRGELDAANETIADQALVARTSAAQLLLMEAAVETVPVGVVIAEAPTGNIISGNSRTEEMLRHPVLHSDDVDSYGEWISFHADGRQVASHEYPLSRIIRDGEDHSVIDVHYQRGDGTRFWCRIIGRAIHEEDGTLVGAAVALIDIDAERRLHAEQQLLIGELNHRVKNAFAVMKSIVRQSLQKTDVPQTLTDTIDQRLQAYSLAHDRLMQGHWDRASILDVTDEILGRHGADDRITMSGPDFIFPARQALSFSMAFYELMTNAFKHGALSDPAGKVHLGWTISNDDEPRVHFIWRERGGPPAVQPVVKGFGTFLIDRAFSMDMAGTVTMRFEKRGFTWELVAPLPADTSGQTPG
ncbi:MAG: HWE histidine kinase domain-containing protein [Pacificimonas sp.]